MRSAGHAKRSVDLEKGGLALDSFKESSDGRF